MMHQTPSMMFRRRRRRRLRACRSIARAALAAAAAVALTGCTGGLQRIDQRVNRVLARSSADVGAAIAPTIDTPDERGRAVAERITRAALLNASPTAESLETLNPPADELIYVQVPAAELADQQAEAVIARLQAYNQAEGEPLPLDLRASLALAMDHSREFLFAEEEYVLAALRLLIERHQWGPRFFNEVTAEASGSGDDGFYDTSLRLVNEFRVTQRLPYGGEVSARALANATEDLHLRVAGEEVQTADIILEANIPLLRDAGIAARASRIDAERSIIYAAREFERFRRVFLVSIAENFLDLVVLQRSIVNSVRQVESLQELAERERRLYELGRNTRFDAALAENQAFAALDRLNSARETYRLAVDRFKVRLGLTPDTNVVIIPSDIGFLPPMTDIDQAVQAALLYRLDLQTERDLINDARRELLIARNQLLPDLNFGASVGIPTDDDRDRAGLDFDPRSSDFSAQLTLGLPLDREVERLQLRQAQIELERTLRDFEEARDEVTIDVRSAVRSIDRARFSLQIQERNIEIAEQRLASIEADPDAATIRDETEAVNDLLDALDARDEAARDLEVAVLDYLLSSGQLRVNPQGFIQPLTGMDFVPRTPEADPEADPDADADAEAEAEAEAEGGAGAAAVDDVPGMLDPDEDEDEAAGDGAGEREREPLPILPPELQPQNDPEAE